MSSKKSPLCDDVDDEFDNEDGIDGGNSKDVMMDMLSSIMQHQQSASSSSSANNSAAAGAAASAAASGQLSDSAAILQMLQQMNVQEMEGSEKKKPHTFWDTQVSVATN